jgi:hypothetical protein
MTTTTANIHRIASLTGREARETRTGRILRTSIIVWEVCDCRQNTRHYSVVEHVGFEQLRRTRIDCADYYDMAPSQQARALAREWASPPDPPALEVGCRVRLDGHVGRVEEIGRGWATVAWDNGNVNDYWLETFGGLFEARE